jgi:hypothetical protein
MTGSAAWRFGGRTLVACMIGVVLLAIGYQSENHKTPPDLIRLLVRVDGERASNPEAFTSLCGSSSKWAEEDRSITGPLTDLGEAALPAVERALDSINRPEIDSKLTAGAVQNLMYVYATIRGPAAYPRLRRTMYDLELGSKIQPAPDRAMAIALNLTSYADSARTPLRYACEEPEPRYVLDHFILAWERNDEKSLREALGASATAAMKSLQAGLTWDEMRRKHWLAPSVGVTAVGYRLEIPGRWSEPGEKIENRSTQVPKSTFTANHEIMTRFTTARGADCGAMEIKFHGTMHGGWGGPDFLIDNDDIDHLLRIVSSCAAIP